MITKFERRSWKWVVDVWDVHVDRDTNMIFYYLFQHLDKETSEMLKAKLKEDDEKESKKEFLE